MMMVMMVIDDGDSDGNNFVGNGDDV